jgi:hypothetical protein
MLIPWAEIHYLSTISPEGAVDLIAVSDMGDGVFHLHPLL